MVTAGRRALLAGAVTAALLAAAAPAALATGPSAPATGSPAAARLADSVPGIPGLPTGVPAAATAPEPALPEPSPAAWPFPNDFSRTSGTGRLDGGASLWTDFLYDDHGPMGSAVGVAAASQVSSLAPVHGGFTYPAGPADGNGADIFRAAVGYTPAATYWRVDWNTLASAAVPIAEWTFSTGGAEPAPASRWPANAGVSSPGIQYALVVSASSASLLYAATGKPVPGSHLRTEVDMRARSFIVRIPTSLLPVSGTWKVRLAAGLADPTGTRFATVPPADGGTGNGVNVYNVTFRSYRQEKELVCPEPALASTPAGRLLASLATGGTGPTGHLPVTECGNFWMENDQANTLATGDVSRYALPVDWSRLRSRATTPQPEPTGYTNRWYVTPLHLGQGVVDAQSPNTYTGPTYLGRVQPYAVYVPTGYDPSRPTPLTWVLHSLGANLNQYGGVAPSQLQEECQNRASICATTEGFSDGGWYFADAEVDFWDVWHQLALAYDLDPDSTVMSGYSMGGYASYKLTLEYPDLFAQSMPLEGPVICGDRVYGPLQSTAGGGQCSSDGDTAPLIANARWVPYVMTYGAADELVPFTGGLQQISAFDRLGYRYYAVLYPAEDHMVFALQNDFSPATSQLGHLRRALDPGSFSFNWYPDLVSPALGIGPTGDYWVSGLAARHTSPGQLASVVASSLAHPDPSETVQRHVGAADGPTPAVTRSLTWVPGPTPAPRPAVRLQFRNVAAASVDTLSTGLRCGTVTAGTDGRTGLTLLRLRPGSPVTLNGVWRETVPATGAVTVGLGPGTTTIGVCTAAA